MAKPESKKSGVVFGTSRSAAAEEQVNNGSLDLSSTGGSHDPAPAAPTSATKPKSGKQGSRENGSRRTTESEVFDDGTITFFWRAHTLTVLFSLTCALVRPGHPAGGDAPGHRLQHQEVSSARPPLPCPAPTCLAPPRPAPPRPFALTSGCNGALCGSSASLPPRRLRVRVRAGEGVRFRAFVPVRRSGAARGAGFLGTPTSLHGLPGSHILPRTDLSLLCD
ncbi:hypothetical protein ANANG_G00201130 [Anguilla anguilla]|uniref:Uncharacterized protein n=1 Tax=Anguilla anguilla TaxID=7936 RepID=A0A9D3M044_ANGAN|nr:hypothetical protein ANANG_G00201130 [Anguilla anguilla]